ncbi:MAG: hypothetical protein L0Z62_39990 [Gemmataceae bacterium]|nr:hypothetical protein [Gemmataceae bacterium]
MRALYRGLREATFAQKSLHPDVANLEALLFEADLGTASTEMLDQWLDRLQRELAEGRLRAEFAYIFGHLLDEWLTAAETTASTPPAGPHPFDEKLKLFWSVPEGPLNLDLLRSLFAQHRATFQAVRHDLREFAAREAQAAVPPELVRGLLKVIGGDITRAPELRHQALAAATDALQANEFAGALTILINNLAGWNWPQEGFALRPLWSRTKWRPYLDEDLLTQLFQGVVGYRWGVTLRQTFSRHINQSGPKAPFPRLLGVPSESYYDPLTHEICSEHYKLFLPMIPQSLTNLSERDSYGGYESRSLTPDSTDTFQELLLFLNAQIRTARAAAPDRPLYIVQCDLRDYYLRVPHEVIACLIDELGFPDPWPAFFKKFVAVPVRHGGTRQTVRRGLVLDHVLSDVFAEYLLLLLDLHVAGVAGVRPMRVVDDIFLVADSKEKAVKAWRAVQEFCRATGLEVNERKVGSVCIGGPNVAELPQGPPRWGMLRLTEEGEWELDRESWGQFQAVMRRQLARPMPVLTLISLYNSALRYILRFLGFLAPLGETHRRQIAEAAAGMHDALFGAGHGVLEELRRRWQGVSGSTERRIPEVLFYWPLTAGGLGLFNPVTALAAYDGPARKRKPPAIPEKGVHWQSFGNRWHSYFHQWLQPVKARTPVATPGLEALLDDFVARSGEVAGRSSDERRPTRRGRKPKSKRINLSVYWQWVVYTYGPQLLSALGTFRFLVTELVPLQLIVRNRIDASSLTEDADAGLSESGSELLPDQ